MAAVPQSSHLERRMMHRTSGKVNKADPASSAEVQKSSAAISTVIPTIIATSGVRFIRHRDCNDHSELSILRMLRTEIARHARLNLSMTSRRS